MKKLFLMALIGVGTTTLSAQALQSDRFTAGVSLVSTFGNYRTFTNQPLGFGVEGTYDLTRKVEPLNFRVMAGYVHVSGKDRQDLGTALTLNALRAGADLTFRTPSDKITPYVGLIFSRWMASASQPGSLKPAALDFSDKGFKLGVRLGVDVNLTQNVVLAADYNFSEWRHDNDISSKAIRGVNPVNPSWMSVTARYRF